MAQRSPACKLSAASLLMLRCHWLLLVLLAGCSFVRNEGPVPQELANCRTLTQQGHNAQERGRFERAETLFQEATEACPTNVEARRLYAEALWRRGARTEALNQITEAFQLMPSDATLLLRWSEMQFQMQQVGLARQGVEEALDLDPKLPGAWVLLGRVHQHGQNLPEALACYQRSLHLNSQSPETLLAVADVYARQGRPERALANLQSLEDLYPAGEAPVQVLALLGRTYAQIGRHERAITYLAEAHHRSGNSPELLYELAEVLWRSGRHHQARQAARDVLAQHPHHQPSQDLLRRVEIALQNTPPRG